MELGSARLDVSRGGVGSLGAISESREFLKEVTRRQRAEPGPGLIAQIIREQGSEINDSDMAGMADGVFNGGIHNTALLLAMRIAVQRHDSKARARYRTDKG